MSTDTQGLGWCKPFPQWLRWFPGRGRWRGSHLSAEAGSEPATHHPIPLQTLLSPPRHPYLKHVVNEIDEGPEEKGGAISRVILHCLVRQPEKNIPLHVMQAREGPSQDRAKRGGAGGVTVIWGSLSSSHCLSQWAGPSEASDLLTTKTCPEIFSFSTNSLPNQGRSEERGQGLTCCCG